MDGVKHGNNRPRPSKPHRVYTRCVMDTAIEATSLHGLSRPISSQRLGCPQRLSHEPVVVGEPRDVIRDRPAEARSAICPIDLEQQPGLEQDSSVGFIGEIAILSGKDESFLDQCCPLGQTFLDVLQDNVGDRYVEQRPVARLFREPEPCDRFVDVDASGVGGWGAALRRTTAP